MSTGSEYQPPAPVQALHDLHYLKYKGLARNIDHDAHTVGLLAFYWPTMDKAARRRVRKGRHYKSVLRRVNGE